jgi:hypothetical protein
VGIDLATQDLSIAVRDDDDIYRVTIPLERCSEPRPVCLE